MHMLQITGIQCKSCTEMKRVSSDNCYFDRTATEHNEVRQQLDVRRITCNAQWKSHWYGHGVCMADGSWVKKCKPIQMEGTHEGRCKGWSEQAEHHEGDKDNKWKNTKHKTHLTHAGMKSRKIDKISLPFNKNLK